MDEEKQQEMIGRLDGMCENLTRKSPLLLTVNVRDEKEAEQILQWMYSKTPPMEAELLGVEWDRETVTKLEAEAVQMIRDGVRPEPNLPDEDTNG